MDSIYGEPTLTIFAPCYSTFHSSSRNDNADFIMVFEPLKMISLKGKMFDFSQITGYSVSVNPVVSSSTKTSLGDALGRAAIGGVLLGGVGAIIGASTARTKTDYETRTTITVFTNSLSEPSIVLDLIAPDKEKVAQIEGVLNIITSKGSPNEPIPADQSTPPMRKLKLGDVAMIKKDKREVVIIDIKEEDGKKLFLCLDGDDTSYFSEEELEFGGTV